jgi:uncharacterized membrane protein YjgN (DUF898 family)
MAQFRGQSKNFTFDGEIGSYIGTLFLSILLTIVTLGIAYPWALVMRQQWITNHTLVDGRRLKFLGSGTELFGLYIIWFILIVITLGIYSLWVGPKITKWVVENTDFE